MSLSMSEEFKAFYRLSGQVNNTIVWLTDGSKNFFFSQMEMQFGVNHVYALLAGHSGIVEDVDILDHTWSVSNVTVKLQNKDYKRDTDGSWIKLSDDLTGIVGKAAYIYLQCGSSMTSIPGGCLKRFDGYVFCEPEYDAEYVYVTLVDKTKLNETILPQNLVGDIYSDAPEEYAGKKIPLVYGKFTEPNIFNDYTETSEGLAKSIPINNETPPKMVVSDHICDALTTSELFVSESNAGNLPAKSDTTSASVTLDDSGRTTYTPEDTFNLRLELMDARNDNLTRVGDEIDPTNYLRAIDRDGDSYATIVDGRDDGAGNAVCGDAVYKFQFSEWLRRIIPEDTANIKAAERLRSFILRYKIRNIYAGVSFDSWRYKFANTYEDRIYTNVNVQWTTNNPAVWVNTINHWASFTMTSTSEVLTPNAVYFLMCDDVCSAGDGITGNWDLAEIYGLLLLINYLPEDYTNGFAAADGRVYGSWITGRSSNYSDGDCIEDPAGIIESLLRDELGLVGADIDVISFVIAENTSVKARLNITEEENVWEIIRKITEQSTFTFVWTATGKAKLIDLSDSTPNDDAEIPFSHIIDGNIKITQSDNNIINTLNVKSRWQAEYDLYRDSDVYNNSASETLYGEGIKSVNWPMLAGTSAQHIARHYVKSADGTDSNGDGLLANKHPVLEIETPGHYYSNLEIGDAICLDHNTVDPQLLLYGETWYNKPFIITHLENHLDRTVIKAVNLSIT